MASFEEKIKIITTKLTRSFGIYPSSKWSLITELKSCIWGKDGNFEFHSGVFHHHSDSYKVVPAEAFTSLSGFEDEFEFSYRPEESILNVFVQGDSINSYANFAFKIKDPKACSAITSAVNSLIDDMLNKLRKKELEKIEEEAKKRILQDLVDKIVD